MQVHYAKARKTNFLQSVAKIAGPFETRTEAQAAADRLEPLYPDCRVFAESETVNMKRGAELLGGPKIEERTHA